MLWFRAPYVLCKKYAMVATFYVMDVCLLREISVDGYGVVAKLLLNKKTKTKNRVYNIFFCNKNLFIIPAYQKMNPKMKVLCRRLYTEGNCHDMYKCF